MSCTASALDTGLLHPLVVPTETDALAPVLWPLQRMLALDLSVQPLSLTFGAPLNVITLALEGCPRPSARMQAVSLSPGMELAVAATLIGICRRPRMAEIWVPVWELADPLNWPLDPEKTGVGMVPPLSGR